MVDWNKEIRMAIDTGKVDFGSDKAEKNALHGRAKLLILAGNCPREKRENIRKYARLSNLPVFEYPGTNVELGSVCGKPFPIAAISVYDAGTSNLLAEAGKKE